tara:strand:- start:33 stop:167 length:135 start_codon:yes stop_codon:yes gene_type:complete
MNYVAKGHCIGKTIIEIEPGACAGLVLRGGGTGAPPSVVNEMKR